METLECPKCGTLRKVALRASGPHFGAFCPKCNRWLKWVQKPKREAQKVPRSIFGLKRAFDAPPNALDNAWLNRQGAPSIAPKAPAGPATGRLPNSWPFPVT